MKFTILMILIELILGFIKSSKYRNKKNNKYRLKQLKLFRADNKLSKNPVQKEEIKKIMSKQNNKTMIDDDGDPDNDEDYEQQVGADQKTQVGNGGKKMTNIAKKNNQVKEMLK